jgi:phosphate transport system substrate-binding protein
LSRIRRTFAVCALLAGLVALAPRSAAADTIRISGTGGAMGTIRLLGEAFRKVDPEVEIVLLPSIGSSGAVKAVLAGRLDIGLCARPLTAEERARGAEHTMYARTPMVFGVHPAGGQTGVTLATVIEVYGGKRTRWRDGGRIRPVLRPPTDSDIPVLKAMGPEMAAAVESALRREGMIVATTDEDLADALESIPGAFGAVTLALVVSEGRAIRVLSLNGVVPSVETLLDGSYPYSKTFGMVTTPDPPGAVRRFIDFVRSPAGASILAGNGQAAAR